MTIRAAVRYLLEGAAGSDRGDIVREIIEIVSEVARGLAPVGQEIPSTMSCRVADGSPSLTPGSPPVHAGGPSSPRPG